MIESLRSGAKMAVIEVGPAPIEIQPLTSDRQVLASAVDAIQATTEPATIELGREAGGRNPWARRRPAEAGTDQCRRLC